MHSGKMVLDWKTLTMQSIYLFSTSAKITFSDGMCNIEINVDPIGNDAAAEQGTPPLAPGAVVLQTSDTDTE